MGLVFDPKKHEYRYDGHVIPGVTSVLAPLQDLSAIPREVLDRKASLGTAVHRACELHNLGTLVEASVHPKVAPYLKQYREFLENSEFEVWLTEQKVFSRRYRYAGTLDLYGMLNGAACLIDIKTACQLAPIYGPQLAAYAAALKEEQNLESEKRFVLRLSPERYWLEPMTAHDDLQTFYAALHLFTWRMKNAA